MFWVLAPVHEHRAWIWRFHAAVLLIRRENVTCAMRSLPVFLHFCLFSFFSLSRVCEYSVGMCERHNASWMFLNLYYGNKIFSVDFFLHLFFVVIIIMVSVLAAGWRCFCFSPLIKNINLMRLAFVRCARSFARSTFTLCLFILFDVYIHTTCIFLILIW